MSKNGFLKLRHDRIPNKALIASFSLRNSHVILRSRAAYRGFGFRCKSFHLLIRGGDFHATPTETVIEASIWRAPVRVLKMKKLPGTRVPTV